MKKISTIIITLLFIFNVYGQLSPEAQKKYDALKQKSYELFDSTKYEESIAVYDEMIRLAPQEMSNYGLRGLKYAKIAERDNSTKAAEKCVADLSKRIDSGGIEPDAYFSRGLCYTVLKKYQLAYDDIFKGSTLTGQERWFDNQYVKAEIIRLYDKLQTAVQTSSVSLNRNTFFEDEVTYATGRKPIAKTIAKTEKIRQGEENAVNGDGTPDINQQAEALLKSGVELLGKGKYEESIAKITAAINLNPSVPPKQINMGLYQWRAGAYKAFGDQTNDPKYWELAIADYNLAIAKEQPSAVVYYYRGDLYRKLHKYREAYDDLVTFDKQSTSKNDDTIIKLMQISRDAEAVGIKIEPYSRVVQSGSAIARKESERLIAEAIQAMRNYSTKDYYGEISQYKYEKPYKLLREALQADPTNQNAIDDMRKFRESFKLGNISEQKFDEILRLWMLNGAELIFQTQQLSHALRDIDTIWEEVRQADVVNISNRASAARLYLTKISNSIASFNRAYYPLLKAGGIPFDYGTPANELSNKKIPEIFSKIRTTLQQISQRERELK